MQFSDKPLPETHADRLRYKAEQQLGLASEAGDPTIKKHNLPLAGRYATEAERAVTPGEATLR